MLFHDSGNKDGKEPMHKGFTIEAIVDLKTTERTL